MLSISTRSVGTEPSSRRTLPFRNHEASLTWVLAVAGTPWVAVGLALVVAAPPRVLWPKSGKPSRTTAARKEKADRLFLMGVSSPGDYLTFPECWGGGAGRP